MLVNKHQQNSAELGKVKLKNRFSDKSLITLGWYETRQIFEFQRLVDK